MFANRFGRGLVAAMESDTVDETPVEEVMAADSAETSLVEAADAGAAVDSEVAQIESAQADSETLVEIADTLEASEETGGLDPVAAELTEVAIESIYNRLGIVRKEKPALEAFADKKTRVGATRIAVEGIKESVKKIWDAIVAAFTRVAEWIKNFVKAIFDANDRLLQRIDALEKRARDTKGSVKESKVKAVGVAKALAGPNGFSKAEAIRFIGETKTFADVSALVGDEMDTISKMDIRKLVTDKAAFDGFTLQASKAEGASKVLDTKAPEGFHWVGYSVIPGNKTAATLGSKDTVTGLAAFQAASKVQFQIGSGEGKETGSEVEVLGLDECKNVLTSARAAVKAIITEKAESEKLLKVLTKFTSEARSAANLGAKEDTELVARSRAVQAALTAQANAATKATAAVLKEATAQVKASLDYVELSLAQYKEAPAAKEEEKK